MQIHSSISFKIPFMLVENECRDDPKWIDSKYGGAGLSKCGEIGNLTIDIPDSSSLIPGIKDHPIFHTNNRCGPYLPENETELEMELDYVQEARNSCPRSCNYCGRKKNIT